MKKFLHIADIHFDAPFSAKDEALARTVKSAQYDAFEAAVTFSLEEKIDGLLIAGDLFDSRYRSGKTLHFLKEQFTRLKEAGIPVFYAPGNHDPVKSFPQGLGDLVHMFSSGKPEVFALDEDTFMVGIGHVSDREFENKIKDFPKKDKGIFIGLAHAMVSGAYQGSEKGKYLPTTSADLEALSYDYFALGHIHKAMTIGQENIRYSGSLQGLHIKETGPKGGILVTIDKGITQCDFIPFSKVSYMIEELVLKPDMTPMQVYQACLERMQQNDQKTILRLLLSGELSQEAKEEIDHMEEDLMLEAGPLALELKDHTKLSLDPEELMALSPVLASALELLETTPMEDLVDQLDSKEYLLSLKDRKKLMPRDKEALRAQLLQLFKGDEDAD